MMVGIVASIQSFYQWLRKQNGLTRYSANLQRLNYKNDSSSMFRLLSRQTPIWYLPEISTVSRPHDKLPLRHGQLSKIDLRLFMENPSV
ncbi:hypothetical protein ACTXT7_008419 [Hymenolepis weldensis]